VVALTNDVNALNRLLATVPDFTRLLGSGESFVPLDQAEMGLINAFTKKDFRTVRVSRAVAEGDGVKIVDGPLVGHEGNNYIFEAELIPRQFGEYKSAVRMYPKNKNLPHRQDFCYTKWLDLPNL
jgi:hypothetical protein